MSDLDKVYLALGLGALAWAFYAEARIRNLTQKLVLADQKDKDAKIVSDVHSLSESALNDEVRQFLGPDKPSAGSK